MNVYAHKLLNSSRISKMCVIVVVAVAVDTVVNDSVQVSYVVRLSCHSIRWEKHWRKLKQGENVNWRVGSGQKGSMSSNLGDFLSSFVYMHLSLFLPSPW